MKLTTIPDVPEISAKAFNSRPETTAVNPDEPIILSRVYDSSVPQLKAHAKLYGEILILRQQRKDFLLDINGKIKEKELALKRLNEEIESGQANLFTGGKKDDE